LSRSQAERAVLPIPDRPYDGPLPFDAKDPDAKFPPIEPLRPPNGAPNVLVILLDDVGFAASSAFGGPCATPTAERLAGQGLKYNRFHTTALCAPTRQALLTGRNHHTVGMGVITELATSAPGYNSIRPNTCAPLAQTLLLNGYSTAQFGKCHEVPVWQSSPMGPFDAWPTGGGGFEYFYGFIGGETNQYYPAIYEGTTAVEPEKTPEEGYHFTEDMTDKSIKWVRQQKALMPDKPFFMYFAPGAAHAPHHVPTEWLDKYKGRFDEGWDKLREEILVRQKELGVVPEDAELTVRHEEIPAWDDMPDEMKPVLARQMEVYAGFLEHTDHHIGRLIDALDDLGVLEDTLVYYIIGDNGASAEGTVKRDVQRDVHLQRRCSARDTRVRGLADRRVRHAYGLQPLRRRLGARHGHALPVDEAGRFALGRNAQRDDRALAGRLLGAWGGALAVPSRHRRRPDRARGRRASAPDNGRRRRTAPDRGREHGVLVRRGTRG
jgi:arylsulfatase